MQWEATSPVVIEYGIAKTGATWHLNEEKPAGYSRVYCIRHARALYEDGFETRVLSPGALYVLPSALAYRARLMDETPLECFYCHVDFFPQSVSRLICLPAPEGGMLASFIQTLEKCVYEHEIDMLRGLLANLALLLARSPHFIQPSPFMREILMYIGAHLGEEITVKTLGEITKYHPNYFISLFKAESRLTPHQYILRLRMQKARAMLLAGSRVAEVASETGYTDSASFTRAFHAFFGVTPLKYARGLKPNP